MNDSSARHEVRYVLLGVQVKLRTVIHALDTKDVVYNLFSKRAGRDSGLKAVMHLEEMIHRAIGEEEPSTLLDTLKEIINSEVVKTLVTEETGKKLKYETNTFRCTTDLDNCLSNAKETWDQALCYALFLRCILKG